MSTSESETSGSGFSDSRSTSITRRKTLIVLLFAGIGALFYKLGNIALWFLKPPRRANEFGGLINIGPMHELPPAGALPVHNPKGKFWLIHNEKGISAIHSSCTHLECLFNWDSEKQVFVCPCHGSEFDRDGHVLRGPAPRDLDRFLIKIIDSQEQVLAQSDPETAAPLAIKELMSAATGNGIIKQQEQSRVMLQVDTGSKVAGAEHK